MTQVATGSYYGEMGRDKYVGIKELKNRLSAYLREVREGRRVLITDRGEVVAEMHRVYEVADPQEKARREWRETGAVVPPRVEKRSLPEPRVRLADGTGSDILDELRGG